jgi:hypothetical protein
VDVTEGLFFGRNTRRTEKTSSEFEEFYKKWTPAQRFSCYVNYVVESGFVFLEKNKFSLNALLDELPVTDRKGIFKFPLFPKTFEMNTWQRQNFMTEDFLKDTLQQKQQQNNWAKLGSLDKTPGISGDTLLAVFKQVKADVDKITARGGQVMFLRTPSSGPYLEAEKAAYPRNKYWDAMLKYTNTPGIHFQDYPQTDHFVCPEWSHLSTNDAIDFTKDLIAILEKEKGWVFKKQTLQ